MSIDQAFLEGTRYGALGPSDQQRGIPQPPLHRILRDGPRVALPQPSKEFGQIALRQAIETRRSLRTYADAPLTLEEVSFLLWATQGIQQTSKATHTMRTVPSAGARHALETVLLASRVEGLIPSVYQYDAACHELVRWEDTTEAPAQWMAACLGQPMLTTCAASFAWIADRSRMSWRYAERGLRYLFLDAGHVCQNLHLAAESISAGACAIGAFDDDALSKLLGLDGKDLFVVYLATVGKRPISRAP